MNNELVKKLTGKNPKDFEFAAKTIVNDSDLEAFSALVEQSDFLFDFIKKNVLKRLSGAVSKDNYKNLLKFLSVYSPDYEDFIVMSLVKFADEDLTDDMLDRLENGTNDEKAYAAKYFAHINDTLAIELLRKYSYDQFDALALNSALALSAMKDEFSYNLALERLKSNDEFEKLSAVRFLVAYNDLRAINVIFETMKKSTMPENIASEISYLQSFMDFMDTDFKYDSVLAVNHLINGLGEIVSISQIFDFQLYEVLEKLIELQKQEKNGKIAIVLLNSKEKFEQLTENDEYIYDEDKDTKNEIFEIKSLLNSQIPFFWNIQKDLMQSELDEWSDFVFSALELVQDFELTDAMDNLLKLLESSNQTIILKTVEVIKSLNKLAIVDKNAVMQRISDENIKSILNATFDS